MGKSCNENCNLHKKFTSYDQNKTKQVNLLKPAYDPKTIILAR